MTIPLRVQPGVGEGFASYLRRVAHTLGTTPRMLAIDLDLTCGETTGQGVEAFRNREDLAQRR